MTMTEDDLLRSIAKPKAPPAAKPPAVAQEPAGEEQLLRSIAAKTVPDAPPSGDLYENVQALAKQHGLILTSGRRTRAQQERLRNTPGVVAAPPGQSLHEYTDTLGRTRGLDYGGRPEALRAFTEEVRAKYGADPRLWELFHDPVGGWKHGKSIGAIGGHTTSVHIGLGPEPGVSARSPRLTVDDSEGGFTGQSTPAAKVARPAVPAPPPRKQPSAAEMNRLARLLGSRNDVGAIAAAAKSLPTPPPIRPFSVEQLYGKLGSPAGSAPDPTDRIAESLFGNPAGVTRQAFENQAPQRAAVAMEKQNAAGAAARQYRYAGPETWNPDTWDVHQKRDQGQLWSTYALAAFAPMSLSNYEQRRAQYSGQEQRGEAAEPPLLSKDPNVKRKQLAEIGRVRGAFDAYAKQQYQAFTARYEHEQGRLTAARDAARTPQEIQAANAALAEARDQLLREYLAAFDREQIRKVVAAGRQLTPLQKQALDSAADFQVFRIAHGQSGANAFLGDAALNFLSERLGSAVAGFIGSRVPGLSGAGAKLATRLGLNETEQTGARGAAIRAGRAAIETLTPDEHTIANAVAGAFQQPATYLLSDPDPQADRVIGEALMGLAGGGGGTLALRGLGRTGIAGLRWLRRWVRENPDAVEAGISQLASGHVPQEAPRRAPAAASQGLAANAVQTPFRTEQDAGTRFPPVSRPSPAPPGGPFQRPNLAVPAEAPALAPMSASRPVAPVERPSPAPPGGPFQLPVVAPAPSPLPPGAPDLDQLEQEALARIAARRQAQSGAAPAQPAAPVALASTDLDQAEAEALARIAARQQGQAPATTPEAAPPAPEPAAPSRPAITVDPDGRIRVEGRRYVDPRDAAILAEIEQAYRLGGKEAANAVGRSLPESRGAAIKDLARDLKQRGVLQEVVNAHRDFVAQQEAAGYRAMDAEADTHLREARQLPQQLLGDTLSGRSTRESAPYTDDAGRRRTAKYFEFDTNSVPLADREAMYAHIIGNNPALEDKTWYIPGFGKGKATLRDLLVDGGIVPAEVGNRYVLGGKKGGGVVGALENAEAAARARIEERAAARKSLGAGPIGSVIGGSGDVNAILEDLPDYAVIGASILGRGIIDRAAWTAELARKVGNDAAEALRPHLDEVWRLAQEQHQGRAGAPAPAATPAPAAKPPKVTNYAGSVNLDKLDVSDEVAGLIRDTYTDNQQLMDKQRRGTRTEEQTRSAAKKLLDSGKLNLAGLRKSKAGTAYNAEELLGIAELHVRLADNVAEALRAYEDHNTTENLAALEEAKTRQYAVMMALQGASTEAGRALQIHKAVRQAYRGMVPERAAEKLHDPHQAPLPGLPPSPPRAPEERAPRQNPRARRPALPEGYGRENKVFTAERADAARQRLLAKMGRTTAGFDPTMLPDLIEIGGYHLEAGARQFGAWSRQMRAELGDALDDADLKELWTQHVKPKGTKAVREGKPPAELGAFQEPRVGDRPDPLPGATKPGTLGLEETRPAPTFQEPRTGGAADPIPANRKPGTLDLGPEALPDNGQPVPEPRATSYDPLPGNTREGRLPGTDVFGAGNTVYREAPSYDALERLRAKGTIGNTQTGDLRQLGGFYVEGGLRTFDSWAKQMRSDLGGRIDDAGLRAVWDSLKPETVKRLSDKTARDEARAKFLKAIGGSEEEARAAAARLAKIDESDPVALTDFLRREQEFTLGQKAAAFYKGNLLSGPKTHLRNFTSNLLHGGTKNAERYLSALVDLPVSKMQGREREYHLRDAMAGTVGYFQGAPQGLRDWLHTVQHGVTAEQARQLDLGGGPEFAGGAYNPYNFGQRMLAGADALFKSMARESERSAQATRQVLKEGLTGKRAQRRYAELLEDPDVLQKAEAAAQRWTFTDDPDEIAKSILKVRRTLPGAEYVLPFFSTPWNVTKETVRYSPVGLLRLVLDTTAESGGKIKFSTARLKSPEAVEILTQGLMGTGVILGVSAYARDGKITGAAPSEANARDAFFRSGRQPYSVKIGNRWVSYQSLGPTSALLGAVAAWNDNYWSKKKATPGDEFIRVAGEVGKTLKDSSALTGLSSFMNALDEPGKYGERFAGGLVSGMVPGSGLLRNAAQATDDTLRSPEGIAEQVQSGLPGASKKLLPKLDHFGREVKRDPSGLATIQPTVRSSETTDPVDRELERLKIFPGGTGEKLTIDNQEYPLTRPEAQEYQRRVGQAMYRAVGKEIRKTGYTGRTDEKKLERLNDALSDARKAEAEKFRSEYAKRRGIHLKPKGLGSLGSLGSLGGL